jgi:DNA-binding transcriptional LysR family regulator
MSELRDRLRWDDIEIFCQIAAHGSLRRAAQASGQSLETIRRRINALEVALGERLFRRTTQGLKITAPGREILVKAREAHEAITAIARISGAVRRRECRRLRLTMPEDIGAFLHVPALESEIGRGSLTLEIRLIDPAASPDWDGTDIALTYHTPDRVDLRRRKVGRVKFGLFRCKGPDQEKGAKNRNGEIPLLLPQDSHPIFGSEEFAGFRNSRTAQSAWRVNSALALRGLVAATGALGLLPYPVEYPDLERAACVDGYEMTGALDLWLGFHADVGADIEWRAFIDYLIALTASHRCIEAREEGLTSASVGFHEG